MTNTNNHIPSHIKKIYLMAICGTGMGSLAGLLKQLGFEVAGSDNNVYPPMSDELQSQNIPIFTPYSAKNIEDFAPDLVIVGNAISAHHEEAKYLMQSQIHYVSMPQALHHFFLKDKDVIVIAGTHGKTTTSSLMAYLLSQLDQDPSFMIGGVVKNFKRNFQIGKGKYFVIEGDEYDTAFFDKGPKFLHYNPKNVIMTSLEFDHADIYENLDQIKNSFLKLSQIIPANGSLHYCKDYPILEDVKDHSPAKKISYGTSSSDWQIQNFAAQHNGSRFDISFKDKVLVTVQSSTTGLYNAQNILACFSVLHELGFDLKKCSDILKDFNGIKRRQEILFSSDQFTVIDDFAHHPTAVEKTISAIQQKFPQHTLISIFEPRSNTSMRNVFQDKYENSFEKSDYTIIAKVFNPDKVKDGNVLNVQKIVENLQKKGKMAYTFPQTQGIIQHVIEITQKSEKPVVALIMSNGGFDNIHQKIIKQWQELK